MIYSTSSCYMTGNDLFNVLSTHLPQLLQLQTVLLFLQLSPPSLQCTYLSLPLTNMCHHSKLYTKHASRIRQMYS